MPAAKPGKHFPKKHIYHSELADYGPIVARITKVKAVGGKLRAFIFPPDDVQETAIRIGDEDGSPGYIEAWQNAPRGELLRITATGRADENACAVVFEHVAEGPGTQAPPPTEGRAPTPAPDPEAGHYPPPGGEEPPPPTDADAPPPRSWKPRNGNGPRNGSRIPWSSCAQMQAQALLAAEAAWLAFLDSSQTESADDVFELSDAEYAAHLRGLAATLLIRQEKLYESTGVWLPLSPPKTGHAAREPFVESADTENGKAPAPDGMYAALAALLPRAAPRMLGQDVTKMQAAIDEKRLTVAAANRAVDKLTALAAEADEDQDSEAGDLFSSRKDLE